MMQLLLSDVLLYSHNSKPDWDRNFTETFVADGISSPYYTQLGICFWILCEFLQQEGYSEHARNDWRARP